MNGDRTHRFSLNRMGISETRNQYVEGSGFHECVFRFLFFSRWWSGQSRWISNRTTEDTDSEVGKNEILSKEKPSENHKEDNFQVVRF